jgi:protein-tyrosine phosphatase
VSFRPREKALKHVYWIISEKLAGRPGPNRAAWDAAALAEGGFGAVLSLDTREVDGEALRAAGIEHAVVELPADDQANEQTEATCLERLPEAQAFLEAQAEAGRKTLVHCSMGRDRTALVGAYFVACAEDMDADFAIAKVRDVRPDALFAPRWEPMALRLIDDLMSQRKRRPGRTR